MGTCDCNPSFKSIDCSLPMAPPQSLEPPQRSPENGSTSSSLSTRMIITATLVSLIPLAAIVGLTIFVINLQKKKEYQQL